MPSAILAVAVLTVWAAANDQAAFGRVDVVVHRAMQLIHAGLALSLKALPAVQYSEITRAVLTVFAGRVLAHGRQGAATAEEIDWYFGGGARYQQDKEL